MSATDRTRPAVPPWMLEGPLGRSLETRLKDEDYDFATAASIDVMKYIAECPMGPHDVVTEGVTAAFRQTMQLLAAEHIQHTYWSLLDLTQICQTEAQALLLLAFASLGFCGLQIRRVNGVPVTVTHPSEGDVALVTVKPNFVGYQTVFVMETEREVPDFDHPVRINNPEMPDVKEIPGHKREAVHLVVEIERAPMEAPVAAKQDAPMAALGFSVVRFGETDVLNDPIRCARQLYDALQEPPE